MADDVPQAHTGEVRPASGRVATYAIHFDRNSLRDSIRADRSLLLATGAGLSWGTP